MNTMKKSSIGGEMRTNSSLYIASNCGNELLMAVKAVKGKSKSGGEASKGRKKDPQEEARQAVVAYAAACKNFKCKPQEAISSALDVASKDPPPVKEESKGGSEGKKKAKKSSNAEIFCLAGEQVKANDALAAIEVLKTYPHCKNLCFWGCATGSVALDAITSLYQTHARTITWSTASRLCYIELMGDKSAQAFSPDTLKSFGEAMALPSSCLQVLKIDRCPLGDDGFTALFCGLSTSKKLKKLSLSYAGLTSEVLPLIAELIAPDVSAEKALGMSEPLYNSSFIESMNFQGNNLGVEALTYIGMALREAHALREINLAANYIKPTEEALKSFGEGMLASTTIASIDLTLNGLESEHVHQLLPFLAANNSIKLFLVSGRIDRDLAQKICFILNQRVKKKGKGKKKKKKK